MCCRDAAGRPRRLLAIGVGLALVGALGLAPVARAAGKGEPGPVFPARVALADHDRDVNALVELGIDVDAVFWDWARVYLIEEEREKLELLGFDVTLLPDTAPAMAELARELASTRVGTALPPTSYHTYHTLRLDLAAFANQYPEIARMVSIGQSVQGRQLLMMKISDNPDVAEDEPEVAYIAAMHGDEVVGKEMCFALIEYLLTNYGSDARVTNLVDDTEIWILPSLNPDGTELGQRYNANGIDLNRDFPDQFIDPVNTPAGRQPETGAVMGWAAAHTINLSTNFHGGAVVANYPFDSNPQSQPVYSPSDDDSMYVSIARTYADNNPTMFASNADPSWNNGICNGADWYDVNGALQDWIYVWHGSAHITMELTSTKWPSASTLPGHWSDNLESMLAYFERVHEGVRGIVTAEDSGAPLAATIKVVGNDLVNYADPERGDYHRILLPGNYTLEVSAIGYATRRIENVIVAPGAASRYDVVLEPANVSLHVERARVVDGPSGNGWIDAGETADLAVTLLNLGQPASSVVAELEPTGWFATAPRPAAFYPDLDPGESAESIAPHHRVSLSPESPAGHKVGFAVHWSSAEASGVAGPLFLPVGEPQCESYVATDLPKAILNRQTTTSTLVVPAALELYDVEVSVDITHGYKGDLRVDLISPSGTPVALHNRSGGSANDIHGSYDDTLPPFDPLSRFHGEASTGIWTLAVNDGSGGNTGTLDAWSLQVCGRPLEATPPEMRFRQVWVAPEGAVFEWWTYPGLDSYRVYRASDPSSGAGFVDVTSQDDNPYDTRFVDASGGSIAFYLVTAVGPNGEGPNGHYDD